MKILHIAAFEGNIGDNASHLGFLSILKDLNINTTIKKIEIRKSYNNYNQEDKFVFDTRFANECNQYDCVVFGGGGFLDYWVENSVNGTTINISEDILKQIKVPILITSIGCHPHRVVPEGNKEKFKAFLDYAKTAPNIQIAIRNDGSADVLCENFGKSYLTHITQILDHGFFYKPQHRSNLPISGEYVALNITADQIEMYNNDRKIYDKSAYIDELSQLVIEIIDSKKYKVVLVPHIHSDVEAIAELLNIIPDRYKRSKIIVAPYIQGDLATDYLFSIYHDSKYVIGSRYHANVCSMNANCPTIGLSPLKRIEFIHNQLSTSETYVPIETGFKDKVLSLMNDATSINSQTLEDLKKQTIDFYREYFSYIKNNK
ncbi:polysaccharide pyruvyl transferase family protein [Photobacterium lutimaris]|uniref:Polysaccharide pyruvyl transferase domain-containing protein n=1 Tax=Photobacterium lutimaris TaxID=388278 RepID=A0A2T3INI0_9GAMM|nr:polysaccharide pyruvyl transferase family protein [Photobacterium lutimaris]PSU29907.1 hypothetical protein C9I99_24560 [Photobacterium lutimaris]TDR75335.1 polysaccharide pyruvyl transferase WcaK-like protein [Photobacterium lutimaris]